MIKNLARRIRYLRYSHLFSELSLFFRAPFTKAPKSKFIIYGSARTGTTICLSLLSTHPEIVADHEIFNQYHAQSNKNFDKIYDTIGLSHTPPLYFRNRSIENVAKFKCNKSNRSSYGFKLLSGQMTKEDERRFIHQRIKKDWKIIFVYRKNILATAISYYIAFSHFEKSSSWFGPKSKLTRIEPQGLIEYLERFQLEQDYQKEILENQAHLSLVYEEDFLDSDEHQNVCNRIFSYLNMPSSEVSSSMKKQGARVVSDRVENWEEVRVALEKTRFKKFLERL